MPKKPVTPLVIHCLEAENIKRLKAVSIKPDGSLVEVTGRNGQGKTSVLDAIWWALTGTNNVQAKPIREGQEKARIRLDLGDIIVTRTFSKTKDGNTTSLQLTDADGNRFGEPQRMLNSMLGALTLDPLEFERSKPRDQFDMVKALVHGVDFDKLAADDKRDREKRTIVGRDLEREKKAADAITIAEEPERVDEDDLLRDLEMAMQNNAVYERRVIERNNAEKHAAALRKQITEMAAEAARLEAIVVEWDSYEASPVDVEAIRSKAVAARSLNAAWETYQRRKAHLQKADELQEIYDAYTSGIAEREEAKRAAIAAAKLPVEGLGFGDDEITLNGQPFEQASDAERLRASVALAMAMNPQIRVIRIRDGNRLDREAREWLAAFAAVRGYQVWMERVSEDASVGIVIEDGAVKAKAEAA